VPSIFLPAAIFMLATLSCPREVSAESAKPTRHIQKVIEGWTVNLDARLLESTNVDIGKQALRLLEHELFEMAFVLPSPQLGKLQKVTIQLDLNHGDLKSMQYHPSAQWLATHGYTKDLAKCVHIPEAAYFANRRDHLRQPCAILHELAHAYHDQVLGFDSPQITALWEKFCESGKYQSVMQIEGYTEPHYALKNAREFFAEMTETYLGENDFYPFNRAELNREEPEIYQFMQGVWGALPRQTKSRQ
jgi:hypothetical protein